MVPVDDSIRRMQFEELMTFRTANWLNKGPITTYKLFQILEFPISNYDPTHTKLVFGRSLSHQPCSKYYIPIQLYNYIVLYLSLKRCVYEYELMIYCNHFKDFRNIRKNSGRVWPFIGWWLFVIWKSIPLGYPNLDPLAHMFSWLQTIGFRCFCFERMQKATSKAFQTTYVISVHSVCKKNITQTHWNVIFECLNFFHFWGLKSWSNSI